MNIIDFISAIRDHSYGEQRTVIEFSGGGSYPLLFFSTMLAVLKKHNSVPLQAVDWVNQTDAVIVSCLQTSFLGMRTLYWLGDLDSLDAARRKRWQHFIKEYRGPNNLLFYSSNSLELPAAYQVLSVAIPESIDKKLCTQLFDLHMPEAASRNKMFIDALYGRATSLSLDQAYLLMRYVSLAGKGQKELIDQWLGLLVGSEKSLFTLSQYFFAQDAQKFFALWATIADDYPVTFWIVFWSEQLFRASNYVRLMQQRKAAEAKRIAFRLPFSFIQRDWRDYTVHELCDAHASIYSVDFNLKNGGGDEALDLFYTRFFAA